MLPEVVVNFEALQQVGENLVIDFSGFVILRIWGDLQFTRIPALVFEANTGTWMCADSQEKMVR